jgi:hypothetical protein
VSSDKDLFPIAASFERVIGVCGRRRKSCASHARLSILAPFM